MSEKNSFLGIGTYLKKINDSFDAKKSLSDVIDNFRCISKEYQEFNSIDQTIIILFVRKTKRIILTILSLKLLNVLFVTLFMIE